MPYITNGRRVKLDPQINCLGSLIGSKGELNYVITKLLLGTIAVHYDDWNALIGVLESVKLELYRRAVSKYEDEKCSQNGDVYAP